MTRNWQNIFQSGQGMSETAVAQLSGIEVDLAATMATVNGGSIASASFRIASDGTTVTAYDKTGATVASGADVGAVFASVVAALPAGNNGEIEFRNDGKVFPLSTKMFLPKNVTELLFIEGNGVTVQVQPGVTGPTAFSFLPAADYDTLQNIWIDNFVIDRNSVATSTGTGATIFQAASYLRVNYSRLTFTNFVVVNMPTGDSGSHINLTSTHLGAGETQTNIKHIRVANLNLAGGTQGVVVQGYCATPGVGVEVYHDDVLVENVYYDLGAVPSSNTGGTGVIVGNQGFGDRCTVRNVYVVNSSDVIVECDGMQSALVDDCEGVDCFAAGFLFRNYRTPSNATAQRNVWRNCTVRLSALPVAGQIVTCFKANSSGAPTMGTVVVKDCKVHAAGRDLNGWNGVGLALDCEAPLSRLVVDGFDVTIDGISDANAGTKLNHVVFISPTAACTVDMRRIAVKLAGTTTNTSANIRGFMLSGNGVEVTFQIDDVTYDINVTGMGATKTNLIRMGDTAGTMRGDLRNVKVIQWADDSAPQPIRIVGTATLTIDGRINISGCDFTKCPVGTTDFGGIDATQRGKVFTWGNIWRTAPAPTTLTGLVTATGKQIATMWPAVVSFVQGSGAAITAIDVSTDGGTTYKNFLTQASAALPAGFDQSIGPLPTDALIKVTFTTTQPTINLIPANQ